MCRVLGSLVGATLLLWLSVAGATTHTQAMHLKAATRKATKLQAAHAKSHDKTQQTQAQKLADDTKTPQPFDPNHNKLYRSAIQTGDISHVDPYTGNMTIHLPLIDVPGNDGLPLQVTLNYSVISLDSRLNSQNAMIL